MFQLIALFVFRLMVTSHFFRYFRNRLEHVPSCSSSSFQADSSVNADAFTAFSPRLRVTNCRHGGAQIAAKHYGIAGAVVAFRFTPLFPSVEKVLPLNLATGADLAAIPNECTDRACQVLQFPN
jgi:hypothetical protein